MPFTPATQAMAFAISSVTLSTDQEVTLFGESMTSVINGVALSLDAVLPAASYNLALTYNQPGFTTGATLSVEGQFLYTTLNSLRQWRPIDTVQYVPVIKEVDDVSIASTPICGVPDMQDILADLWTQIPTSSGANWGTINTSNPTNWVEIET